MTELQKDIKSTAEEIDKATDKMGAVSKKIDKLSDEIKELSWYPGLTVIACMRC